MKNIVFFEDVFGNFGGIEKMIVNITSELPKDKYHITLLLNKMISEEYRETLLNMGVDIVELQDEFIHNPIKRHLKGVKLFDKYIKEHPVDTIHFHISNSIDMMYVSVAQKRGVKNRIAHSHNSNATSKFKVLMHYTFKTFLKNSPSHYISCSTKAAYWLYSKKKVDRGEVVILKNAIVTKDYLYNEERRQGTRQRYDFGNQFIVGHIGRFNEQKNHRFLIDIFTEFKKLKENAELVLIGEGDLKDEIKQYVKEKGVEDSVRFMGNSNEVPNLLSAMDVFLLPSLYEGLPVVLVETQAASLPALVSNTITKEVDVSKYVKYMSLERTPDKWAKGLLKMAEVPREDNYQTMYDSGFDIASMVKELDKIYSELN